MRKSKIVNREMQIIRLGPLVSMGYRRYPKGPKDPKDITARSNPSGYLIARSYLIGSSLTLKYLTFGFALSKFNVWLGTVLNCKQFV